MTQYTGIIFDKDGTLFDYAATWEAWAKSLLLRLCAGDDALAKAAGQAIGYDTTAGKFAPDSIAIAGTPGDLAAALIPYFPGTTQPRLTDVINEEAAAATQVEVTPLVPFLNDLRVLGLKLGVATNDAEAPARAHLAQAGVLDLFDFVAGYDSGFGGKPAPGQLLGFCDAVGVTAASAVMVGDSTHDLLAAKAAGMRGVGVLTGYARTHDLSPHADVVLPDISHLRHWLEARA